MNLSIEAESFRPLNPPELGDFKILVPLKLGGLGGNSYLHSATPGIATLIHTSGSGSGRTTSRSSFVKVRKKLLRCQVLAMWRSRCLEFGTDARSVKATSQSVSFLTYSTLPLWVGRFTSALTTTPTSKPVSTSVTPLFARVTCLRQKIVPSK